MAKDPLDEMLQFLKPESRIDLKHLSSEHLVGLSASEEGVNTLLKNEQIVKSVIDLTDDKHEEIAKNALLILVNITGHPKGARELLKYQTSAHKNILQLLIGYVLDPQKNNADLACMTLSNVTRLEDELEIYLDAFIPHLNDILNAFVNIGFNKKGSNLNHLAPMFCNLSCSYRIRKWLTEENPHVPLIKLLPFCNYDKSSTRKLGVIGTVRNLSFDAEFHKFLLSPDLDLLTYLLSPIMGNEDYADDEMDQLPISLQYLPKEKQRDPDPDIRIAVMETLYKFCVTRPSREVLRQNGVYYALREHHKWETDSKAKNICEDIISILILKEDEIGTDDFSTVVVPDDMAKKFSEMDNENENVVIE